MGKSYDPSIQHVSAIRRRLGLLAAVSAKTAAAERQILAAAESRLGDVMGAIDRLRPRVNLDATAADQYQEMTLERGQLELVIANARKVLGR